MIDYLRNYVVFYVQKIDVLRQRKIMLLKNSSFNKKRVRKNFNRRTFVHNSSIDEIDFYKQLQSFFDRFNWMIHHNSIRIFYLDVNDFRRDFEIMIYHLKSDVSRFAKKNFDVKRRSKSVFFFFQTKKRRVHHVLKSYVYVNKKNIDLRSWRWLI